MTDPTDEELDRLLARGRMGGPGRERVLGRVLESQIKDVGVLSARRLEAQPKKTRMASWAGVFAFASAGAVAATFLLVRRQPDDSFTSKGGTAGATPRVEVACIDGEPSRCAMGSTLVFRAEDCEKGGYLAAFAERAGTKELIWYFPSSNDPTLPEIAPKAEPQVLARGARIGPEHTPGSYAVTMVLVKRPLSREQIADGSNPDVLRRWTAPLEVTP